MEIEGFTEESFSQRMRNDSTTVQIIHNHGRGKIDDVMKTTMSFMELHLRTNGYDSQVLTELLRHETRVNEATTEIQRYIDTWGTVEVYTKAVSSNLQEYYVRLMSRLYDSQQSYKHQHDVIKRCLSVIKGIINL